MEKAKETPSRSKTPAPPQVDEQPKLPEKKNGPQRSPRSPEDEALSQPDGMPSAARASEMLASPEGGLGAPIRARMGSMLQRQVGNARVGRTLDAAMQAKRTVDAANDLDEQTADSAAGEVRKRSVAMVQRQPSGGSASAAPAQAPASTPASDLALTPRDEMVTASLLHTLERFQKIPIDVDSKTVSVRAVYFNNKFNRLAEYEDHQNARIEQKFKKIIKALKGHGARVLEGTRGHRSAGEAVQVGKASPGDIKAFVEAAIAEGVIERYAIASRKLKKGEQLVKLPESVLQTLIQEWMQKTGVGLDCNGFVQQALIQVREEERAMTSLINSIADTFGLPTLPMPEGIKRQDISVGGFKTKENVKTPTELRPGDVWVTHREGHIRIVTDVREVVLPNGKTTIQFDTAESTVFDKEKLDPGPIALTWQTGSLTSFKSIKEINDKAKPRGGTFHHILSSDKLTTNEAKKAKRRRRSHRTP
jgi:hypothetical protein